MLDYDSVIRLTIDENDETLFTEHEVHEVIELMHIDVLRLDNNVLIEVSEEHLSLVTEVMVDYDDVELVQIM